jgi:hypothetical protein
VTPAEILKATDEHNARAMALLIARAASAEATVEDAPPPPRNNPYAHGTTRSKLHGVRFNRDDQ